MSRLSRDVVLASVLCLSAVGCKRLSSTPSLATKSAAEGRRVAMGTGVLPNLDRSLTRLGEMAEAMGLPFDAAAVREKLLAEIKVPPEAAKAIDLAAPVALVMLPPPAPGKEPQTTAALGLRSKEATKQALTAFGKPIATKDDAAGFTTSDGKTFWLWHKGDNVVIGSSLDALVTGANLALESLSRSADDLHVTANPEAIARSRGTDVKSALSAWSKQVADAGKAAGTDAVGFSITNVIVASVAEKAADVDQAALTVRIDATSGGTVAATLRPKAGSRLAESLAKSAPYALEPAVLTDAEPFMVAAGSPSAWLSELGTAVTAALPPKAGVVALVKPLIASLTGAFSFSASFAGSHWQQAGVYELAADVAPQAFVDQVVALLKSQEFANLLHTPALKLKVNVARDKNVATGDVRLDVDKVPPQQAQAMKSMMGDKVPFAITAEKDRAQFAVGKDARARLARLAGGEAPMKTPPGRLGDVLAETRSDDGFLYIDPVHSLRAAFAVMPASPLLEQAATVGLPMWFTYRGGQTFAVTWRIPMSTIRSAGALVPIIMMLGSGAPLGGP